MMTLRECYAALGGDYDGALSRIHREGLLEKFALRFPDDPTASALRAALSRGDAKEAFRAAHTLKGVCQNLGFTALGDAIGALTEALRAGNIPRDAHALLAQAETAYARTVDALRAYRQAKSPSVSA